jgi:hypothetical protein
MTARARCPQDASPRRAGYGRGTVGAQYVR